MENTKEMIDDWVDLGLPSGLLWATCNVGATKPEDYGDYFAWGETQPKRTYTWENYKYNRFDGTEPKMTKYCSSSYDGYNGYHDNLITLQLYDDAAAANVPGSRMPTRAEWEELMSNCTWKWITLNGVKGWCVTGRNDKSIFLPAGGDRWAGETDFFVRNYGYYWSSSLADDDPDFAWYLFFKSGFFFMSDDQYRKFGFSVRPVK